MFKEEEIQRSGQQGGGLPCLRITHNKSGIYIDGATTAGSEEFLEKYLKTKLWEIMGERDRNQLQRVKEGGS